MLNDFKSNNNLVKIWAFHHDSPIFHLLYSEFKNRKMISPLFEGFFLLSLLTGFQWKYFRWSRFTEHRIFLISSIYSIPFSVFKMNQIKSALNSQKTWTIIKQKRKNCKIIIIKIFLTIKSICITFVGQGNYSLNTFLHKNKGYNKFLFLSMINSIVYDTWRFNTDTKPYRKK